VLSNALLKAGMAVFLGTPALRRTLVMATFVVSIAAIVGAVIVDRASRFVLIQLTECVGARTSR
jgi:hypothetical protein